MPSVLSVPTDLGRIMTSGQNLGEVLDNGTSGLVVVARTNAETMVDDVTTRAKHQAKAQLQADVEAMKKELATI